MKDRSFGRLREAADILLSHDPGMVDYGMNPDEYMTEAEAIVARLGGSGSWQDARQVVLDVLEGSLGAEEPAREGSYEACARDLWEMMKSAGESVEDS